MIQKQRSDTSDVFDQRLDSDGPQKCTPESITGTYAICPGESKIPFTYQTFLPEDVRTTTTNFEIPLMLLENMYDDVYCDGIKFGMIFHGNGVGKHVTEMRSVQGPSAT
jgi:hypothetical protein